MPDTKNSISFVKQLRDFAGGPVIGVFVSLFTVPLITRLVLPDELGKSSLFTLAQTLFGTIILLGLDQAYVRYFNSKEYNGKTVLYNAVILPLLVLFILSIGILVFKKPLSAWLFSQYEPLIVILLCPFLLSIIINRFAMLIIRMELRGKLYSALSVLSQIINFIFLLLFLLFYERSFKSIVYAAIIAGFINAFLPVLFTLEKWKLNFSYLNKDLINKLLQFGLPLVPATALTWILNSFDKIGLKQWSSYEQLGLYAAAFKVAALLGVLQTIFTTAWVPVAYQWYENNEDIKKFDKVNTCVLTVFSFAFSLIVIFRDIIILFLGPDYRNISLTMIYLLFVPFMYTLGTAAIGIDLTKKTIYNLVAIFICTLFNIAGNYVLIPVLGAQGAALSTAFSYTLWFFVRFFFARKLWYKFSMKNYIIDLLLILLLLQCVQFNAPRFIEIIVVIVIFIINLFMIRKKVDILLLIPGRIK